MTVTAFRIDDFDGPIDVSVKDLPPGLHATSGVISSGQTNVTLLLSADVDARLDGAVPLEILARARLGNQWVERFADPDDKLKLISLMPKSDIIMTAETKQVVLEPGGTAEVEVAIRRNNKYGGRVPVEVRNLPPGVRVLDVGLNGVLINENETQRKFVLAALPTAPPVEQPIIVSGDVETRAPQQSTYAAEPIMLIVKAKAQASALSQPPVDKPSANK